MKATHMSFIRYRCKSEKDFKLFSFDGMSCSVGYLKQFLMGKSSKSASRRCKDEIDFIITDASTNEEYRNVSDLIPRNTSVIVVRQLRETFESLTPETAQRQHISFDDIIDDNLRSGLRSKASTGAISCRNTSAKATTELEPAENIRKSLHQTAKPTSFVCQNCKRCGHIKRHCPLLIGSSTAKICRTTDSTHKSVISIIPTASISASRSYSYLVNNKNIAFCDVNDTSIKESLSNKTQTSIGTHHVVPAPLSSAFSSSNIFLQQSSLNLVIDPLSEDDHDAKLSQIRSVPPLAPPAHRTSRYSPYPLPHGHIHPLSISEKRAGISCNNFVPIPREITGVLRDKCGAFLYQNKRCKEPIIERSDKKI